MADNNEVSRERKQRKPGAGVDVGTAFIVCARMDNNDDIRITTQRDAFFDVEKSDFSKKMLDQSNVSYIEKDGRLYVVGQEALELSNVFNKNTRRPLRAGVISPNEKDAFAMIEVMLKRVTRKRRCDNELLYFSVPANPIDANYNVIFHETMFRSFFTNLGYNAKPINEAHAIVLSELADEDFTGLAISFGAGMTNVGLSYLSIPALSFSVAKAGDWIDENAATAAGVTVSKITSIKEAGVDIVNPQNTQEFAISAYYRNLINYVVKNLSLRLERTDDVPSFPKPITVILSGGTSLVGNFTTLFEEEIKKYKFPFTIDKVKVAEDQLNSVAQGCLIASLNNDNNDV